jgi:60 kDa SS-A/Ro ribonucleoprotein
MNKKVFENKGAQPDTVNKAGGTAFSLSRRAALMQHMATNTFNASYYTSSSTNLVEFSNLLESVGKEKGGLDFIAKATAYTAKELKMKDTPAFALVWLSTKSPELFSKVWNHVVYNGKMLRNVVEVVRSGHAGRRNFGQLIRRHVQQWFDNSKPVDLMRNNVGNPSLGDIIRMCHVKPDNKHKAALYAHFTGAKYRGENFEEDLPGIVREIENFREGKSNVAPRVPFNLLISDKVSIEGYKSLVMNAGFTWLFKNIASISKRNLFSDPKILNHVVSTLEDTNNIDKDRNFPHNYYMAIKFLRDNSLVPHKVMTALEFALDHSCKNYQFDSDTVAFADISASMDWSVTGFRQGATSAVQCSDVAKLYSAAVIKSGGEALTFHHNANYVRGVSKNDTVATIVKSFSTEAGGTNLNAPLNKIYKDNKNFKTVIWFSDMQSWLHDSSSKSVIKTWNEYRRRNPGARAIYVNLMADSTAMQLDKDNMVLNIGGFSDKILENIIQFAKTGTLTEDAGERNWVELVDNFSI